MAKKPIFGLQIPVIAGDIGAKPKFVTWETHENASEKPEIFFEEMDISAEVISEIRKNEK